MDNEILILESGVWKRLLEVAKDRFNDLICMIRCNSEYGAEPREESGHFKSNL